MNIAKVLSLKLGLKIQYIHFCFISEDKSILGWNFHVNINACFTVLGTFFTLHDHAKCLHAYPQGCHTSLIFFTGTSLFSEFQKLFSNYLVVRLDICRFQFMFSYLQQDSRYYKNQKLILEYIFYT